MTTIVRARLQAEVFHVAKRVGVPGCTLFLQTPEVTVHHALDATETRLLVEKLLWVPRYATQAEIDAYLLTQRHSDR